MLFLHNALFKTQRTRSFIFGLPATFVFASLSSISVCVYALLKPQLTPALPLILANILLFSLVHFLSLHSPPPNSFFCCFSPSRHHVLPSGAPCLPPPLPLHLSAVPVGLWAGRVWAPAAFSKASAAAPATDPSNTATLTSIYTYRVYKSY